MPAFFTTKIHGIRGSTTVPGASSGYPASIIRYVHLPYTIRIYSARTYTIHVYVYYMDLYCTPSNPHKYTIRHWETIGSAERRGSFLAVAIIYVLMPYATTPTEKERACWDWALLAVTECTRAIRLADDHSLRAGNSPGWLFFSHGSTLRAIEPPKEIEPRLICIGIPIKK